MCLMAFHMNKMFPNIMWEMCIQCCCKVMTRLSGLVIPQFKGFKVKCLLTKGNTSKRENTTNVIMLELKCGLLSVCVVILQFYSEVLFQLIMVDTSEYMYK